MEKRDGKKRKEKENVRIVVKWNAILIPEPFAEEEGEGEGEGEELQEI